MPPALSGAWSVVADGDADAAVPAPSGRRTALHYAAANGFIGVVIELLVGGADQRITDSVFG